MHLLPIIVYNYHVTYDVYARNIQIARITQDCIRLDQHISVQCIDSLLSNISHPCICGVR